MNGQELGNLYRLFNGLILKWPISNGLKAEDFFSRTITISLDSLIELCHYDSLPLKNRVSEKLLSKRRKISLYRKSPKRLQKGRKPFLGEISNFEQFLQGWKIGIFIGIKMPWPPKTAKFIIPGLWV